MQTFLPYADFTATVKALDSKRLGKQRVECLQLLNAIAGQSKGWVNHPAAKMWRGYVPGLKLYMNYCIAEWIERGYKNTMKVAEEVDESVPMPPWLGNPEFHRSHQSNLIRKDPAFYGPKFPGVPADLPYLWPVP